MSDHAVFLLVLGACCGGVVVALAVLAYAVERAEHDDRRWR
jgi:hypothetical protein